MNDPHVTTHAFLALLLALISGMVGARTFLSIRSGTVRVWNSIRLDRRSSPRRYWAWLAFLLLVAMSTALVVLAYAASLIVPSLGGPSQRALDAAQILLIANVVLVGLLWNVGRSRR